MQRYRNKAGVVGAIPHESMGCYNSLNTRMDVYVPAAIQKL